MIRSHAWRRGALAVSIVLVGGSVRTLAQPTNAQNKLLARRAAEADCYRKLAETVKGVKLNSETYVRDFVAESDEIRTAIDTFIKGVRLGQARYYDDGICEVDAEITVEKLVTKLKELHATHYRGNSVTTVDIESVKKTIKQDVFRVTGAGAPRPDLPADLPEGVEEVMTQLPSGYVPTPSIPAIWKTVPPQARLMADRAARLDAMRKLLEQIKGIRLTSDTLVRDFITESDEIRASGAAKNFGLGASVVSKYYHDDDLIVELTMEIPVEKVITRIQELHSEHYHGSRVTTTDITNVKKTIQRDMVRATGGGVPPARFIERAQSTGVEMPAWSAGLIRATGKGTDPQLSTAQGKLRAARAAELDAMRKLAEQIYGLSIRSETLIRDFVTEHREVSALVEGVISGAVAQEPVFSEDSVSVTVSVGGSEVWSVVHRHSQIVKRRG